MSTQTIIEDVIRDGVRYRIEHTMVETIVDDKTEKATFIDRQITGLQKQIDDLKAEQATLSAGIGKP